MCFIFAAFPRHWSINITKRYRELTICIYIILWLLLFFFFLCVFVDYFRLLLVLLYTQLFCLSYREMPHWGSLYATILSLWLIANGTYYIYMNLYVHNTLYMVAFSTKADHTLQVLLRCLYIVCLFLIMLCVLGVFFSSSVVSDRFQLSKVFFLW